MLRDEIRKLMTEVRKDAHGDPTARIVFPDSFAGFRGHFPDHAVLPGVCSVQCVLVMLESGSEPVRLCRTVKAKFFAAILPNEEILFACRTEASDSDHRRLVRATATRGGRKVVELVLEIAYDSQPAKGG